jgi:hypothetical protein
MKQSNNMLSLLLLLPHAGGPLSLLSDKNQEDLVAILKEIPKTITQPSAILISSDQQKLIYDY